MNAQHTEGQYEPGYFAELKKKVAYAAITRAVAGDEFGVSGDAEGGFSIAEHTKDWPAVTAGDTGEITDCSLSRYPTSEHEHYPWRDFYQPWLDAIDSTFENWDQMPDPADFEEAIGAVKEAVRRLTINPGDDSEGGSPWSGPIGDDIGTVHRWCSPDVPGAFQGDLIFNFDVQYGGGRMARVVGNQRQAMIAVGLALQAEKELWTRARIDILDLMDAGMQAFESGGTLEEFQVVGAFAGLIGAFIPGAQVVTGAVEGVTDFVSAIAPPEEGSGPSQWDITGGDAESIYESLKEALEALQESIEAQERAINQTCSDALDHITASGFRDQVHIHPGGGLEPAFRDSEQLRIEVDILRRIGYEFMPSIAAQMIEAAELARGSMSSSPFYRPSPLGWNPAFGPYFEDFSQLYELVWSLLTSSAVEIVSAGERLAVGAGFIEDTDGAADRELKGIRKHVLESPLGWGRRSPEEPLPTPPARGEAPLHMGRPGLLP